MGAFSELEFSEELTAKQIAGGVVMREAATEIVKIALPVIGEIIALTLFMALIAVGAGLITHGI